MTLTDEQLAEWEKLAKNSPTGTMWSDTFLALIQEVRRLREIIRYGDDAQREQAKWRRKAEAEADSLRKFLGPHGMQVVDLAAERDCYARALDKIIRMAEEPHLQIARAAEVAQAALNQQGDTQSKQEQA